SSRERLHDVSRVLDATICNHRDVTRAFHRIEYRRQLGNADSGDDARSTNRSRSNTALPCIDTTFYKRARSLASRDIARDELHIGEELPHVRRRLEHTLRVAVRRIDHQHIDAGFDQRASAIPIVRCANRGSDAQSAVLILVGIRKIAPLVDVLYRDQSTQRTLLVDHRQLLDAMLAEYRLGFVECSPDGGGDGLLRGHRLAQSPIGIPPELEVAVGDASDELSVAIHHW